MLYLKRTFSYEYPIEEADFALVGIPWDFSQTGYPTRYGPLFIREALRNVVGYDPETKTNPFERFKFCDLGDVEVVPGNWKLTEMRIIDTVKSIFETNPKVFPIFLGGDHLITLGILNSLKPRRLTVVDLDAHRDLAKEFLGEKYSHFTWAYHALKDFEIVQVGCRSWAREEEELSKKIKQDVKNIKNPVYLTIDLDVLETDDVGTPEPGGIGFGELTKILKQVCENEIIGMDIVECAATKINSPSAVIAANLIKKVLGFAKNKKL
jgi:agmatinase